MSNRGFDYVANPYSPDPAPFSGLYPPMEAVHEHGYDAHIVLREKQQRATSAEPTSSFSTGYEAAAEACGREFDQAVGMDQWHAARASLDTIRFEIQDRVEADPQLAEVRQRWSSCMYESGHSFSKPREARVSTQPAGDTTVAVADYTCRRRVGYNELVVSLETKLVTDWLDQHAERARELQTLMADVVQRATKLDTR